MYESGIAGAGDAFCCIIMYKLDYLRIGKVMDQSATATFINKQSINYCLRYVITVCYSKCFMIVLQADENAIVAISYVAYDQKLKNYVKQLSHPLQIEK